MSGHRKWSEIRRTGDEAREARVAKYRDELDEAMTLAELRQAREMTQAQLAEALDLTQPGVSRIEHQTDLYLSTLRSYVGALGGQLDIVARFSNVEVPIRQFGKLDSAIVGESKVFESKVLADAQRSIDTAMKQISAILKNEQVQTEALARRALSAVLVADRSGFDEVRRSIAASTELAKQRIRDSLLMLEAREIRTLPGDEGWDIKIVSSAGDEGHVVSLRTKKDAVTVGRVLARSTGGKLVVHAHQGGRQGARSRRSSPKRSRSTKRSKAA